MGVGVEKGAEICVHAIRSFVCDPSTEDLILFKVDFRNAFNTARRDKILEAVKINSPQDYAYVWQAYGKPSNLYFGEDIIIKSQEGVQQGNDWT